MADRIRYRYHVTVTTSELKAFELNAAIRRVRLLGTTERERFFWSLPEPLRKHILEVRNA